MADSPMKTKLTELEAQHLGFLRFNSGASPGQVKDSTAIIDLIAGLRAALERAEKAEARLAKAVQYLKEGKARFTPNTTNSFVDDFIAENDRSENFPLRTESKTYEGCHLHSVFPREYCRACYPEQTPPKTAPDNQMDYPPAAVHLDRSMVSVHGSDGCSSCDTGRITIYAASRQCLDCRTSRPPRQVLK